MMTTEKLAEELISLWRILRGLSHPVRRAEMTPEQYWLLRVLSRAGPLSIGALAAELGIAMSSATSACKRLEKAGRLTRPKHWQEFIPFCDGAHAIEDDHRRSSCRGQARLGRGL